MQQQGQARQVGVSNFLIDQLEDLAAQGLPKPVLQPVGGSSLVSPAGGAGVLPPPGHPGGLLGSLVPGRLEGGAGFGPNRPGPWENPSPGGAALACAKRRLPHPQIRYPPAAIAENLDIFDFALTPEEMAANRRPGGRPPYLPTIPIPTTAPAKASSPLRPRALGAPGPCLAPRPYTPPCLPGFRRCTILLWQFLFWKEFLIK